MKHGLPEVERAVFEFIAEIGLLCCSHGFALAFVRATQYAACNSYAHVGRNARLPSHKNKIKFCLSVLGEKQNEKA